MLTMMRLRRVLLPLALPVLVVVASACVQPQSGSNSAATGSRVASPAASSPSATKAGAPFDQQFIDMMTPHHEGALEMARIAQARSQRPEIKALAADILRSQAAEIEQMKAWRKAWYGSDQTPPMSQMPMVEGMTMPNTGGHGGHGGGPGSSAMTRDMSKDVEALRTTSEPFDRAFIDAMIPPHPDASAAAKAAETRAQRSEIKELAKAIIAAQEREVAQMQEWRRQWFGSAG